MYVYVLVCVYVCAHVYIVCASVHTVCGLNVGGSDVVSSQMYVLI